MLKVVQVLRPMRERLSCAARWGMLKACAGPRLTVSGVAHGHSREVAGMCRLLSSVVLTAAARAESPTQPAETAGRPMQPLGLCACICLCFWLGPANAVAYAKKS